MKLGKLSAKWHQNTLRFPHFLNEDAPLPNPAKVYWGYKVPADKWGMLGNDVAGNCVVAGSLHMIMNWAIHTGNPVTFTADEAIEIYSRLTGFDPKTGMNDNGLVVTDFLEFWRTVGIRGKKILGWLQIDHSNAIHFNQVDYLFGGVAVGQQVPQSMIDQFNAGQPGTVVAGSPIQGGHFTPYFNYGSEGRKMVTWAKLWGVYNDWIDKYVDEAYGIISEDWFDKVDVAPNHFRKDQLWKAVKQLQS